MKPFLNKRLKDALAILLAVIISAPRLLAETVTNAAGSAATNAAANPFATTASLPSALPDNGASVFRVFGALILVIALFLAGVWLFKNWQRFSGGGKNMARLNVLEVKSLGQRQALYVIGYERQRFLVASTTGSIILLTALPDEKSCVAEESAGEEIPLKNRAMNFAEAFQQVLNRK